jgi:hypothetical protein
MAPGRIERTPRIVWLEFNQYRHQKTTSKPRYVCSFMIQASAIGNIKYIFGSGDSA